MFRKIQQPYGLLYIQSILLTCYLNYLKSMSKRNAQHKHFNNPHFYKLLLFWTIFKLQNCFWTFKCVLWSQNITYNDFVCIHFNDDSYLSCLMSFYEVKTIMPCQNNLMPQIAKYVARLLRMRNIPQTTVILPVDVALFLYFLLENAWLSLRWKVTSVSIQL